MISMSLYEKLTEYCASDAYPFHMPGHKRRGACMQDPFSFDITEIDGFDNLHHAEGILKDAQERAAALYHSSETHFLVNGSTAGILSAILACVPPGGLLLMARNSHKSAFHAAGLRDIRTQYLYPEAGLIPQHAGACAGAGYPADLNGPIDPSCVEQVLSSGTPRPSAIFLTSPTYDGVVSDVKAIAALAHRYRIPLIVDEAHGAHFGMHPAFPPSSVSQGADIVIHSLHKTLPSLTQTALLHVNGDLVDRRQLRSQLSVFQTSSPSYVLMASIDSCVQQMASQGRELFESYVRILKQFRARAHFAHIDLPETDDPSRILLVPHHISARTLYDLLRDRYRLQSEMLAPSYVLMLSSVADTEEGFCRLLHALEEIDRILPQADPVQIPDGGARSGQISESGALRRTHTDRPIVRAPIFRALNAQSEKVPFEDAAGKVSAEYLYLYPPGIPLLAPGEEITPALLRSKEELWSAGYELQGTEDHTLTSIWIMKEDTLS